MYPPLCLLCSQRTLQKSLKGQLSASDVEAYSPLASTAQSRSISGETTPQYVQSALASGQSSPSNGKTRYPEELEVNACRSGALCSSCGLWEKRRRSQTPRFLVSHRATWRCCPRPFQTNMRYLKNVVLKYMTGRRAEVRRVPNLVLTVSMAY